MPTSATTAMHPTRADLAAQPRSPGESRLRRLARPPDGRLRRLRFTKQGKYFVGLCLGIGFAAINTGNNLLYLVFGTMLALIVGSGVLSEANLRRIAVSRTPPARLVAKRGAIAYFEARNGHPKREVFSIDISELPITQGSATAARWMRLAPLQHATLRYTIRADQRGIFKLSGIRITTRFPFSLFEKSHLLALASEIVVYPELNPASALTLRLGERGLEEAAGKLGRDGEFFGLREYQQGDDARDIYWRKSAQLDRPVLRELHSPRAPKLRVKLDRPSRLGPARVSTASLSHAYEERISVAASQVDHYLRAGFIVALQTPLGSLPFGQGPGHRDRLLTHLATLPPFDANHDASAQQAGASEPLHSHG